MANLPSSTAAAAAPAADASGFRLFGQVIQPDAHSTAAGEEDESAPPAHPQPPPPPPPPPPLQAAGGEPLPCPRCGSRETKFCYFNNYNVRQPRHLCRACRRYWTAGGALRRVASASPGRRRPRPSARSAASAAAAAAASAAGPSSAGAESVDSQS